MASGFTGFRNRIINGAMVIAQRGTSFAGLTSSNTDGWPADRFRLRNSDSVSVLTVSQVADAPSGFVYSARAQVTTINATPNSETFIEQIIEGNNLLGLAYGTASAQSFTLSFWVKASVTGTYNIWMYSASSAKAVGFSYAVSSANTWTKISATIFGDTAAALASDNSAGLYIRWYLDAAASAIGPLNATWSPSNLNNRMVSGSVRLCSTLNATFQITGVQLEAGNTSSSFEYRDYGNELALCQRYFQSLTYGTGNATYGPYGLCRNGLTVCHIAYLPVQMRTAPTATYTVNAGTNVLKQDGGTYAVTLIRSSTSTVNEMAFEVEIGSSSLNTTGCAGFYGGSFVINATSEL
jgi:hypothetical protein